MSISGAFSQAFEGELRQLVREHSVIFLLDKDQHYNLFFERLNAAAQAGGVPYKVARYQGSYLELLVALDGVEDGVDLTPLVVHLPGFNEERIHASPLLELYRVGYRHRRALGTLVEELIAQLLPAAQRAEFVAGLTTLEAADEAIAALLSGDQEGLMGQLRAMRPLDVFEALCGDSALSRLLGDAEADEDAIRGRLVTAYGIPPVWEDALGPLERPSAADLVFMAAGWAMGVEYVHDLRRPPRAPQLDAALALPKPTVELCQATCALLRARYPTRYRRIADEVEAWLIEEVEGAQAEDLGKVDTFRFEEDRVLKAALLALEQRRWEQVAEWAADRMEGGSFWVREEPARTNAWTLIARAAQLGQRINVARSGLPAKLGVPGAVERYTKLGAPVDQLHRQLEQLRLVLLTHELPEFEIIRARLDQLREVWREWADSWARDFNALCVAEGFLPAGPLQQRGLFDEVVRPMTRESGVTAYLVVDALRYEMADELRRALENTPSTTIELVPRLSELPSVTEIGMNALAPVSNGGKLLANMTASGPAGFSTGEFRVHTPETRRRAMHERVGGATCPLITLGELLARDSKSIKQSIAQARLVVVHSQEIDAAGESGNGPAVFDVVLRSLRTALKLLREAGVRRFVITADHGFLLLDERATVTQPHGRKADPKRRHVYAEAGADHAGEVRVSLASLGYEGAPGWLMFPETTAVFDTGRKGMSFVHGGNSLQERVIPVLTIVHRTAAGGQQLSYRAQAEVREPVAGMHCLEVRVEVEAQMGLDFGGSREVELALRVPGDMSVLVELCQARGGARLAGGAMMIKVGASCELFFRLSGPTERRCLVEVFHPSAQVELVPIVPNARFAVSALRAVPSAEGAQGLPDGLQEPSEVQDTQDDWLSALPDEKIRKVFAHLAEHGVVTEAELTQMMGSPRGARLFAARFDEYSARVPFGVRVDTTHGKRYMREGAG